MGLAKEACVPCRAGEDRLSEVEALMLLVELPKWKLVADGAAIRRRFRFENFVEALAFVNGLGELAEAQNHHPDIAFGWGYAEVTFTTHATGGLHRNDFVMAAKVDNLS
jgi:4a-hydroxytetrahydrobiopterin dehydratase